MAISAADLILQQTKKRTSDMVYAASRALPHARGEALYPRGLLRDLHQRPHGPSVETLDSVVENCSLAFIAFFRFYYMSLSQGNFRTMAQSHKLEIAVGALLATHEYPFMALNRFTDVGWEFVQAIYMCVLIVMCLAITIRDKLQSGGDRSREKHYEANASKDHRGSVNAGSFTASARKKSVIVERSDRQLSITWPNTIYIVTPMANNAAPEEGRP